MASEKLLEAQKSLISAIGPFDTGRLAHFTSAKIIHDPVWGTCKYEPWEASILELPLFQRLRGLRQTGFAHLTYPAAEHSRFQHTLGVVEAASRVYDSVVGNGTTKGLSERAKRSKEKPDVFQDEEIRQRYRILLRLAALVHDTGHSVFSHTSERIYGLIAPFPDLASELVSEFGKKPGAAEIVVYLMVTSPEWREAVDQLWPKDQIGAFTAPSESDWQLIGHWVMGQESDPMHKFIADIVSGPVDADKLDYVFRDGYVAGIPVGYDLERLIATVSVDPQEDKAGKTWWRLTVPVKGINALEQLVMGRLVLNSYLYHHQKCRAAEAAFERAMAREFLEKNSVLGRENVWELFRLQDAHVLNFAEENKDTASGFEVMKLLNRELRVRVVEFRFRDLLETTEQASSNFQKLLELGRPRSWNAYRTLLEIEDEIATKAGLNKGDVVIDIPKDPDYADLENLLLPGRQADEQESPSKVLNYRDWIAAYKVHRAWIRVFAPRGANERKVWEATRDYLAERALNLPEGSFISHETNAA